MNINSGTSISIDDPNLRMQIFSHSRCFPRLLHFVLSVVDDLGLSHIISWSPDGAHFAISNTNDFMAHVAPRFFPSQSNYKSFYRQLNLWGFERVGKIRQKGCAWRHPHFLRDRPDLVGKLKRRPFKMENVLARQLEQKNEKQKKSDNNDNIAAVEVNGIRKMNVATNSNDNNAVAEAEFVTGSEAAAVHGLIALKKYPHDAPSLPS